MKKRIALFNLDSQVSLRSIANNMLELKYKESSPVGFFLNSVDDQKIKGKHICKIDLVEDVINPFGEVYSKKNEQYIVNNFIIYEDFLELSNPSKTLKYLKKDLLISFDGKVKFFEFNVNVFGLLTFSLEKYKNSYVKEIDILSYDIVDDSVSKMNIKGGRNFLDNVNNLFLNKNYEISKFTIVFNYLNSPDMIVHVSEKGGVSFSSTDLVEELVRDFLETIKIWEK